MRKPPAKEHVTFTIEAGLSHRVQIPVERDCVLEYQIQSTDFISLSFQYEDPSSTGGAPTKWIKTTNGFTTLHCTKRGKLTFDFSNNKSWFTSVIVDFTYNVHYPLAAGLERPYCVLISSQQQQSNSVLLDCFPLSVDEILDSGRRFLGFRSDQECRAKTGRELDFQLESDLVGNPALDLHQYLAAPGKQQQQKDKLKVILGTFILDSLPQSVCMEMIALFFSNPQREEVDTARSYGKSEEVIGRLIVGKFPQAVISTKVNPFPYSGKALDEVNIKRQVRESFEALKVNKVKIVYLHQPDSKTSLEVTLKEMNRLHCEEGAMFELGLSNFSAWQVVLVYHLCMHNGWIVPTVYQGVYNCLAREVEQELFPALRAHNMRFYCYNPLAGGLLCARYAAKSTQAPQGTRFSKGNAIGDRYLERYWHDSTFAALDVLRAVCKQCDVEMTDLALRWLVHHSSLDGMQGDGIILGASRVEHLQQNLNCVQNAKPLPQIVLNAVDDAWRICRFDSPKYFRS